MKKPSYPAIVKDTAMNAITFWRHMPEAIASVLREALELCDSIFSLLVRIVAVALVIVVPALVVISPLTGWIAYRRRAKRHERACENFGEGP